MVFWIAAFEVALYLWIAVRPKALQVAGYLHRTMRGREQLKRKRDTAVADGRRVGETEHLL